MLQRAGRNVGVVGLGAWQLGADWGTVDDRQALSVLSAAVEAGVSFIDTADAYRPSTRTTRCSTPWTRSWRRAGSPRTE